MKTFTKSLLAVSMSFGLAACGPDGGASSSDWAGHPVDPAMATGTAQFVGVWKYESLDAQITCVDGIQVPYTMVSGTETFTHGARRDQVLGVDDHGCPSDCQVSGNIATCQTDPTACGAQPITVTADVYTYESGNLSEFSSIRVVVEDGTECIVSGTARLVPVK